MQINPYLAFNGNCDTAFKLYERVLRGKIVMKMTYGEAPGSEQTPPEMRDQIMHVRLIAGDAVLMGGDSPPQYKQEAKGFCVSISVSDPAEAERIFGELSENGKVQMPMEETFWAIRFGMLIDQYGTPWMINCEKPMG